MYLIEDINMMHRRNVDEYPKYDKDGSFKREIEDPAMSPAKAQKDTDMLSKTSLVNQASQMKAKNNAQYIMHLVEGDSMNQNKYDLLRTWNQRELDFRLVVNFKNQLYGSPILSQENMIPVSEFQRIRANHDNAQIRQGLMGTEDLVLQEIIDPSSNLVDLNIFSDLVDLFMYLPNKEKVNDQHISP